MRSPPLLRAPVMFLALLAVACGPEVDGPLEGGEREPIAFEVPRDAFFEFLDAPWPSDVLRVEEGEDARLLLRAFPNPYSSATLEEYLGLFQTAGAYAASGGLYFNVPAGLNKLSLPASPAASLEPDASMFLVSVDEPSVRYPIEWVVEETGTGFLPAGTVSVFPLLGAVPGGRAALVVTSSAQAANGARLGPSEDLAKLMACEDLGARYVEVDCAPYLQLVGALGVPAEEVALLQIVTFANPAAQLLTAADAARALVPEVEHEGITRDDYAEYTVFEGTVSLGQFQAGAPPYGDFDGTVGGFVYDDDGRPIVQRTEAVRFVLTVPRSPPPADGFPVAINGHGTGGSLNTGLGNGASAEAHQLARAGYAMLAISEPLHATREGFAAGNEEVVTFNFLNPVAGRDIWRQSVLEKVQLVSAVAHLDLPDALTDGRGPLRFDEDNVAYFGHSQGGIVGAMFVSVEDRLTGAFLSGAGGGFAPSLIEKTEPVDLSAIIRTVLNLPSEEPLDRFHPLLTLLQIWVDPADPVNYGQLWREREAQRTPHLVVTSGLQDLYTPKRNHGGLAGAFGLPLVAPVSERVEILRLKGIDDVGPNASGDLVAVDGAPLTAGMLQYPDDGHFAVFFNSDAQDAFLHFFATLSNTQVPEARVRP